MSSVLEIREVSKNYGTDPILTDVSFSLERGEALAITGPSGSGKTTLLSIAGLLQQATGGQVLVDGAEVTGLDQLRLARIRGQYFGFVFQRARLINSLTALENVLVPAWFTRSGRETEKKARELLVNFGLDHRLNHRPQELSLGQLRRVALARALLLDPVIILADEPTNDLDPRLAKDVADALLHTRSSGTAVIIVTHDPALAARADRRLRLTDGRLATA
ncbi:MAG: ABC transporter ATP-binding protein [Negativicutes bacterium]|nr:ABC transporter ATP-binding protein [Negativicutes bacterium]